MRIGKHERFWGCMAHLPIISIIWTGYLIYIQLSGKGSIYALFKNLNEGLNSLPIIPLALTVLSIPIALGIQHMQKKFPLARNNAHQSYLFNVWLLKAYAVLFIVAGIGIYFSCKPLVWFVFGCVALASANCFLQAFLGMFTAWNGRVYHYWHFGKK